MLQNLEATLYTVTQGSFYDLSDKRQILQLSLVLEGVVVFCFSITSFLVSSTANAGFNVVLNAFINVTYVGGSFYALNYKAQAIFMGVLIGVTVMLAILDFMTAVYWGQLSHCTKLSHEAIDQYSCQNRTTYGAVSAFASILFVLKTVFLGFLIYWHEDLIDETEQTTGVHDHFMQRSSSGGEEELEAYAYGQSNRISDGSSKYKVILNPQNDIETFEEESFSI